MAWQKRVKNFHSWEKVEQYLKINMHSDLRRDEDLNEYEKLIQLDKQDHLFNESVKNVIR